MTNPTKSAAMDKVKATIEAEIKSITNCLDLAEDGEYPGMLHSARYALRQIKETLETLEPAPAKDATWCEVCANEAEAGRIEMDNNGPIVDCWGCKKDAAPLDVDYLIRDMDILALILKQSPEMCETAVQRIERVKAFIRASSPTPPLEGEVAEAEDTILRQVDFLIGFAKSKKSIEEINGPDVCEVTRGWVVGALTKIRAATKNAQAVEVVTLQKAHKMVIEKKSGDWCKSTLDGWKFILRTYSEIFPHGIKIAPEGEKK